MQVLLYIPDKSIPINPHDFMDITLIFCDGEITQCSFPFRVLPKGHGRLIDADALITGGCYWETEEEVSNAPTILEAEGK